VSRADPPLYAAAPAPLSDAVRLGLPLRPTAWSVWDALWAILGSIVLGTLVAFGLLLAGRDLNSGWILVAVAAPWIALAGWPLLVTLRRGNGPVVDLGLRWRWPDVGWGLLGGVAAFGAGLLASLLTIALIGDFDSAAGDQAQELADTSGPIVLLLFALMVIIGAPIAEELTFRGLLWSGLAKRGVRPWIAVLVSAAAFALIHFEPERLLVLLAIGSVLGLVRWFTGSMGACIVAHAVNNAPGALGILVLGLASG
jgi:membrane protease YdiL (CAAX protease family)